MAEVVIGGHRGMDVVRVTFEGAGAVQPIIRKRAVRVEGEGHYSGVPFADLYDWNIKAVHNEHRMLEAVEGLGIAPTPLVRGEDYIDQEDLGTNEGANNMEAYRRNCAKLCALIRSRRVRHGDLTFTNMIIKGNWVKAVDWQEGHYFNEPAPQKSPYTDSYLLCRTIWGTPGPNNEVPDTPRVARRWGVLLGALGAQHYNGDNPMPLQGKTFMDLGCFQGDFPAWAAAEGMVAYGLDQGGFRTGENSIEIGRQVWGNHPFGIPYGSFNLRQGSILDQERFEYDVVMMFSTWSYIVQDYDRGEAERLIWRIMHDCGVLFFENQLYGDGPGPAFFKTDLDVERLLGEYGRVTHLGRFHVAGRPAHRSVFMVEPR